MKTSANDTSRKTSRRPEDLTGSFREGPWFHGSPLRLSKLRAGSCVTPYKEIARAFSHKPSLLSISDDCSEVKHDGDKPGFLYVVAETTGPADITLLEGTRRTHWQTNRDLRIRLIQSVPVSDPKRITEQERKHLKARYPGTGYGSTRTAQTER